MTWENEIPVEIEVLEEWRDVLNLAIETLDPWVCGEGSAIDSAAMDIARVLVDIEGFVA